MTAASSTSIGLAGLGRVDPLRFFSAEQVARVHGSTVPLRSAAVELTLATAILAAVAIDDLS